MNTSHPPVVLITGGSRGIGLATGRVATDMQVQYSGARIGLAPDAIARRLLELAGPPPRATPGTCVTLTEY